ncbi:BRCA1-associated RING domain protein 1 isoform X1 [Prunus dulcis]|uniref:BRCA1-associated RING domain protein 1 isoform X1 n=1 Tax=Prunus dulcis TaxID=3755 RepID=UPI001482A721|nr:BRCA1-associated RING domain protein 1 isoform X1 [Prunus dulcis]
MADSKCSDSSTRSMMNPWVLHFQKLGLELKCSFCLSLLHRPTLLPCNHIFCNSCIPNSTHFGKECPLCKVQVADRDLRPAPFMENIVAIYKSLDASFCANLLQPISSGTTYVRTVSPNISFAGKMAKESFDNGQGGNSNSGQSIYSSGANERVWVPCSLNRSVADVVDTNCKVDKCVMPIDGFNGVGNPNSPPNSQIKAGGLEECMTIERDMNQVAQSLPDSPPSFGDTKCSDNDSSDRHHEQISESSLVRKSISEIDDSRTGLKRHDSSATENDGHLRHLKKQKNLNFEPVSTTNSELEHGFRTSSNTICAFCQSSTISEVTGPILHYANEKLVVGDEAAVSNAIPVHRICIDWAPQVYFVGESVKKLKAEVARGAKLKCSKCGLKGAALGCFVKSCRRSYHVTCAIGISKCRWDRENFLLLCPAHCSVKFPSEKSNSENPKICPLSNSWVASNGAKEWILCPSGLSSEEKLLLIKFAKMNGGTVSKIWRPEVTHVIAAVDEDGAYVRTLKTCMAILAGRWILKIDWVKACMEAMHHVDEEPYEVSLDNYGCHDGPKTGRLRALNKDPKLFNGLSFYFAGDFVLDRQEDLEDLIIVAGGTVFDSTEEALEQSSLGQAASRTLVVYNLDPQEGCKLGEEVSILWQRSNDAQDIAAKIGSQIVGHTWLLESIARCELQPLVC